MIGRCLVASALAMACFSCISATGNPPATTDRWQFASGFESAVALADLFPADLSQWTNVQCVEPNGTQKSSPSGVAVTSGLNRIGLDTTKASAGSSSLKLEAPPTGSSVSKAAIAKEGVDFRPGDEVNIKFKAFLEDNGSAENAFVFDLESTELSGYPGRRLAISSSQEFMLESKNSGGAYGSGPNFNQPGGSKVPLPKGQWVSLEVALHLARDGSGTAKIWQDGVLVVDAQGKTFPSESDITHYNWVEFGLTANSSSVFQRLWIDEVEMVRLR